MIKLSKKLTIVLFLVCLLTAAYHLLSMLYESIDIGIFDEINSFFLSILISTIFLDIYNKRHGNSINFMTSPFLTISLLFVVIIIFSIFIIKLIHFGFQISNEILFWQISAFILGVLSLGLLIRIHVKLIKKKELNNNVVYKK